MRGSRVKALRRAFKEHQGRDPERAQWSNKPVGLACACGWRGEEGQVHSTAPFTTWGVDKFGKKFKRYLIHAAVPALVYEIKPSEERRFRKFMRGVAIGARAL